MHIQKVCSSSYKIYAEEIGKTRDIDLAMATMKKLRPVGFGARWPQNLTSIGYYKTEEY